MSNYGFKDLIVWQKSMALTKEIYVLVKRLPKEELYALSDQMRRAAVSIPSNIAEGQGRTSPKEFAHFLSIANGSKAELETQLLLCVELGYLESQEIQFKSGVKVIRRIGGLEKDRADNQADFAVIRRIGGLEMKFWRK